MSAFRVSLGGGDGGRSGTNQNRFCSTVILGDFGIQLRVLRSEIKDNEGTWILHFCSLLHCFEERLDCHVKNRQSQLSYNMRGKLRLPYQMRMCPHPVVPGLSQMLAL